MKVVHQCQTAASTTTSEATKAGSIGILQRMQVLLDLYVQNKVEYDVSADNMRVLLTLWSDVNPAGIQELILNPVDRYMAISAFQILTYATEEWKLIQKDYVDYFRYEVVDLCKNILSRIPDEYKKTLPFVNMCLWAWQDRLEDNNGGNLWDNLSCSDFDLWMSDETKKRKEGGYKGNTEYKLTMQTFYGPIDKTKSAVAEGCFSSNIMCVAISPSFTGAAAAGASPSL